MNTSRTTLDLSRLPEHARIQMLDFYDFLTDKYSRTKTPEYSGRGRFSKFLATPVRLEKIMRFSREELHER